MLRTCCAWLLLVALAWLAAPVCAAPEADAKHEKIDPAKLFKELDKDGNGKISKAEFAKFAEKKAEEASAMHLHAFEEKDPKHQGLTQDQFTDLVQKKGPELFAWALDLGIWTLIVFLGLLFILRKTAWGPILEGLRKREENIRQAAEEAKLARAEVERTRLEHKAEMDKAYAKIPLIMEDARRDATRLIDEAKSKATADIQAERLRLRREMETARDQALQMLWEQAAQLATLIAAKAIRRNLTPDDRQRLVEEALGEVRDAEEKWRQDTHA